MPALDSVLDVVVLGPLNIDLIVVGDAPPDVNALVNWMALSEVTLNVAGSAGYPALVMQKLGLRTGLLSVVADDSLGSVIYHDLTSAGVDLSRLQTAPDQQSSIAIYMLLFGSKKRPLTGRPVLHQPWPAPLSAADSLYIASARLVHVAGYLHYPAMWDGDVPSMLYAAQQRGQMVSLDPQFPLFPVEGRWMPGVEKLLPNVDVLLLDQDEAFGITAAATLDDAAHTLLDAGAPLVVIKQATQGATVYTADGETFNEPALAVPDAEIVDTIGAGDAFDGGFLAALLDGGSIAEAAKIGTAVAALSLRGHGASNVVTDAESFAALRARILGNRSS